MAEAAKPGLSVEACVARLKGYHYAFLRLHAILTARITAEPIYELKTGFSHHAYLCSEHVMALRTRVGEMREVGATQVRLGPALRLGRWMLANDRWTRLTCSLPNLVIEGTSRIQCTAGSTALQ